MPASSSNSSESLTKPAPNQPMKWSSFVRQVQVRVQVGLAAAWIVVICGYAGGFHWLLDLCSHFYLQCAIAILVGTLACIGSMRRGWLVTAGLAWLFLLPALLWFHTKPDGNPKPTSSRLRVVSCNVLTSNIDKESVLEFIGESEADVVLLMEVDTLWSIAIKGLQDRYPHQYHLPREDNFGIVLISKHPWSEANAIRLDDSDVPTIQANIDIHGKPLRFFGTHPLPPIGKNNSHHRNTHFVQLAKTVRESSEPTLVVGDLNCTSWSFHFQRLLRDGKLKDSRQGFGIQPSWPTSMKLSLLGFMRIPIDHALVNSEVQVIDRKVGPNVGSDHFPIIIDIAF